MYLQRHYLQERFKRHKNCSVYTEFQALLFTQELPCLRLISGVVFLFYMYKVNFPCFLSYPAYLSCGGYVGQSYTHGSRLAYTAHTHRPLFLFCRQILFSHTPQHNTHTYISQYNTTTLYYSLLLHLIFLYDQI